MFAFNFKVTETRSLNPLSFLGYLRVKMCFLKLLKAVHLSVLALLGHQLRYL